MPWNLLQKPLSPGDEFPLSVQQNSAEVGPPREPWSSPAPCQLSHARLSLRGQWAGTSLHQWWARLLQEVISTKLRRWIYHMSAITFVWLI